MMTRCEKCKRRYDDAEQRTICPHAPLGEAHDSYCPICDTTILRHGKCQHQIAAEAGTDRPPEGAATDASKSPITGQSVSQGKANERSAFVSRPETTFEDWWNADGLVLIRECSRDLGRELTPDEVSLIQSVAVVSWGTSMTVTYYLARKLADSPRDCLPLLIEVTSRNGDLFTSHVRRIINERTDGENASVPDVRRPDTDTGADGNGCQGGAGDG